MKHVYRVIIFVVVFLASVGIFSGQMKETQGAGTVKSVKQSSATFPIMTVRTQGYDINVLHGYNSNLKASLNRESVTPIGIDKQIQLIIEENETNVRKLRYELRKVNDSALMESDEISVLEDTKEGTIATLTFSSSIEQRQEYALKVTAITKEGKKIHYFTHMKYYGDESFLKEKMDFVMDFHNSTFKSNKLDEISSYLELSYSTENNDYASIDITSSKEKVGWGKLHPEVVSEVVPTIKEFNIETAAVYLDYFVKLSPKNEKEQICKVKEFFRVRYSGGRMYLLKYDRDLETLFSPEYVDAKSNQIRLGIGNKANKQVVYAEDHSRIAFVSAGELWSYSVTENTLYRVFSFRGDGTDYIRAGYDQHDSRVISIDGQGNMDFVLYGYMNSGDYEGCVGMLWYKYYAGEQRIEEQVFIPMETTYQILKENLDSFMYVNDAQVFYFSVKNVIYYYDKVSKQIKAVVKNVADGDYCYVKGEEGGLLAWQGDSDNLKSREIILMDLDTKKKQSITAKENEHIQLVGSIDSNIVYGISCVKDQSTEADGSVLEPMNKIIIADKEGKVLKEYKENNIYITKAYVEENVVKLERVKKSGGNYVKIKEDSIQNQMMQTTEPIGIDMHLLSYASLESYIYMNTSYELAANPSVVNVKSTLITENSIVRLEGNEKEMPRYYVYAEGVILEAYDTPAKAIMAAEDAMGVVINEQNQIVYERAGKVNSKEIGSLGKITCSSGINSKAACVGMVLKYNHLPANTEKLAASDKSVYGLLKENMGDTVSIVNLRGCTLDEVLYFVSGNKPVIAVTGGESMVLITGYTESTVSYYNPGSGVSETKSLTAAQTMFEAAGNVFISYVQ